MTAKKVLKDYCGSGLTSAFDSRLDTSAFFRVCDVERTLDFQLRGKKNVASVEITQ